jgi:NADH-quinone oxidoreductase subunit N
MIMTLDQFVPFVPEIFLSVAGFAVLLAGIPLGRRGPARWRWPPSPRWRSPGPWCGCLRGRSAGPQLILGDMLVVDQLRGLLQAAGAGAAGGGAADGARVPRAFGIRRRRVRVAGPLRHLGMFVMASGANLASLYVGLELMALSVYVLVGYFKLEIKSNEAAVKYFVLGAASSAVLLYGFSLVYGALGTLDLAAIRASLVAVPTANPMLMLGMVLVAFGMLFKVAAVPFHVWTPDAYEGAPTPVTAFISVAPKAAAFAMFLRLFAAPSSPGSSTGGRCCGWRRRRP